ncbi:hypothetical protein A3746_32090 [Oleibacter sp. HI0075]|nr:hypothetical protein A3746_08820 [Oleibacter sp. HI0075]KZZ05405.1 hypothetical protein A3746_32090 [Oleibacter sp. HI0075]
MHASAQIFFDPFDSNGSTVTDYPFQREFTPEADAVVVCAGFFKNGSCLFRFHDFALLYWLNKQYMQVSDK